MALVLAIVIKALFVQAFYIPSESMEPGLIENDRILVQKVSYWFDGEPERGDVVVFKDPGGWLPPDADGPQNAAAKVLAKIGLYPQGGHLVKRVIGVAGDTIVCCDKQGRLSVNGTPLDEDPYIREQGLQCNGPRATPSCDWTAGPVPEGTIFVMGDNRGALRRLLRAHVQADPDRLRARRRVRAGRPGRRQGLRPALAHVPVRLDRPPRLVRGRGRRRPEVRRVPAAPRSDRPA